jgi:alanine racemase
MAAPAAARLTVDLNALANNHAVLRRTSATADLAPVLKADAYGLGIGPVARRLWAEGARRFFVARLAEGEDLRAALSSERPAVIYVLDGLADGAGPRLAASGLTPVLCTVAQVNAATAWANGGGGRLSVGLHVDTGMSRQGLTPDEVVGLLQAPGALGSLDVDLVMSHLGSAADPESPRNARQLAAFSDVRRRFPAALASLAASAGAFLGPEYHFEIVRAGVSLFGGGPLEQPHTDLHAVATLTARILDVRDLRAGDILGYGENVRIDAPTRVAVVAAGYADGIFRSARAGGYAWFAGARRRLLVVSMDMLVIDLGDAAAQIGQTVELLGPGALLDDQAQAAGTVAHEILVRLSRRAERVYLGEI